MAHAVYQQTRSIILRPGRLHTVRWLLRLSLPTCKEHSTNAVKVVLERGGDDGAGKLQQRNSFGAGARSDRTNKLQKFILIDEQVLAIGLWRHTGPSSHIKCTSTHLDGRKINKLLLSQEGTDGQPRYAG